MEDDRERVSSRLMVLEEKLEYQEYTIEKLNDVIIAQQAQLDKLEAKLERLDEKVTAGQLEIGEADNSVPPPHY